MSQEQRKSNKICWSKLRNVRNKKIQDHDIPAVISDEINGNVEYTTKGLDQQQHYTYQI